MRLLGVAADRPLGRVIQRFARQVLNAVRWNERVAARDFHNLPNGAFTGIEIVVLGIVVPHRGAQGQVGVGHVDHIQFEALALQRAGVAHGDVGAVEALGLEIVVVDIEEGAVDL